MKARLVFALICASVLAAHADVVIEQKTESAMMTGGMTMKIKGDLARMDMYTSTGDVTVLMNVKLGEMTTLMHSQRLAMRMNMEAVKQKSEAAQKQAGIDFSKIGKPRATGLTEKVGVWTADLYDFDAGGIAGKLWVVRDFPNLQILKEALKKVTAASTGGFDPNKLDVPGMVVKSMLITPAGPMTSLLVRAVEEPVADYEFIVPKDYIKVDVPDSPAAPK